MVKWIERALRHYEKADFVLQMKARFFVYLCVAILLVFPIVMVYSIYFQIGASGSGLSLNMPVLLAELSCAAFVLSLIWLLLRGHFTISAHMILLAALITTWTVMIVDRSAVLIRLDSIAYILGLLAMMPLIITRFKTGFILYTMANLIMLWVFVFWQRTQVPEPAAALYDYLSDNTVAIAFIGMVAYNVFAINKRALDRAEQDIAGLKRAEETIRSQKAELIDVNEELTAIIGKMEETTREYEEANVRLTEAQQDLIVSNERLRLSEEKFSKAFHFSPLMVSLSTLEDGRFVDVSASFTRIAGYSRQEMIGRTSLELNLWANPRDSQRLGRLLKEQGFVHDEEICLRSRSGLIYIILYSAEVTQIFDSPHVVSLAIDISDRRRNEEEKARLEEQLRQVQRMESIGRLAGGVAHDFNNLLSVMLGYAEMAQEDPTAHSPSMRNALQQIQKAGERAQNLTRQLLAFGRKQVLNRKVCDLNQIVLDFRQMLVRLLGEDIKMGFHLGPDPWMVHVDASQIEQILLNLAVNARDAMPQGGHLRIATANVPAGEGLSSSHRQADRDYVLLEMSDTGCGMDTGTLRQIFEPFFTTKGKDKGTGLGLATVYGIVKQHGGEIVAESEPGQGSTFRIYVPRSTLDADRPDEEQEECEAAEQGPSATILVVEDDPDVRRLTCDILTRSGYTVLEAQDARDAVQLGFAHRGQIELLLTDVVMPEMHGPAVADKVSVLCPQMKVVYLSGYADDELQPYGILAEGIHFIRKPVTARALLWKIRSVLRPAPVSDMDAGV